MKKSLSTVTVAPRSVTVNLAKQMHPAVGRSRLYAALRQGHIRSSKVGKRIAIDVVDLDRWVMAGSPVDDRQMLTNEKFLNSKLDSSEQKERRMSG